MSIPKGMFLSGMAFPLWLHLFPGGNGIPYLEPLRSNDVPLFTVSVVQKRYPGRPVGIVFYRGHLCRHIVLIPLKVDYSVLPLCPATHTSGSHPTPIVPASRSREGFQQASFGFLRGYLRKIQDTGKTSTRRCGFVFSHNYPAVNTPSLWRRLL